MGCHHTALCSQVSAPVSLQFRRTRSYEMALNKSEKCMFSQMLSSMTTPMCQAVPEAMRSAVQLTTFLSLMENGTFTNFVNHHFTFFWRCVAVNPTLLSVQFHLENILSIHILLRTHAGIFNAWLNAGYSQRSAQHWPGGYPTSWEKSVPSPVVETLTATALPVCSC